MFAPSIGRRVACRAATVLLLCAAPAAAHIDLLEPEARAHGTAARGDTQIDENSNLKSGPCGQVVSGRTERVATYAPGQTITVRVREENAHVSYLRVALALDGESFPLRSQVPPAPETQEQASAAEQALGEFGLLAVVRENNDTAGFVHEIEVTLPNATCQSCTLQVLQFMYDDPAAPYYFQCADLVLADDGGAPDAGAAGDPAAVAGQGGSGSAAGSSGPEAGRAGPANGVSSPGAQGASGSSALSGAPAGAAAAATPAPGGLSPVASSPAASAPLGAADSGGSGCSLSAPAGAHSGGHAALGALALAWVALRRRR